MFQNLPNPPADDDLEYLAIKVDNLTLINIYIPPSSSCSTGYMPTLAPYLNGNETLLLEDINAHDTLWNSNLQDTRGSTLADLTYLWSERKILRSFLFLRPASTEPEWAVWASA